MAQTILARCLKSWILRKCLGRPYFLLIGWIWKHLPRSLSLLPPIRLYGMHLHALVLLSRDYNMRTTRKQYVATFFLRNRPELELMRRLLDHKGDGSSLQISVLGCSKGAEVYSIAWIIRSARPDLKLRMHAVDISQDVLELAERGVYSLKSPDVFNAPNHEGVTKTGVVTWNTWRDQDTSIFERMTDGEMEAMFNGEGDQVTVKSWLRNGIIWHLADAGDPELVSVLGPQDMVVANRFLCHMEPVAAGRCLRNIARLEARRVPLCLRGRPGCADRSCTSDALGTGDGSDKRDPRRRRLVEAGLAPGILGAGNIPGRPGPLGDSLRFSLSARWDIFSRNHRLCVMG